MGNHLIIPLHDVITKVGSILDFNFSAISILVRRLPIQCRYFRYRLNRLHFSGFHKKTPCGRVGEMVAIIHQCCLFLIAFDSCHYNDIQQKVSRTICIQDFWGFVQPAASKSVFHKASALYLLTL